MADIPVTAIDAEPNTLPLWAGWLAMAGLITLVWILFQIGASGIDPVGATG